MNHNIVMRNIGRWILLMLLQVLIFNNVYLGGYINPCLYLLFVAMLPTSMGCIPMMLVAFVTGLCVDVSTNMLGFHTAACTAVGFLRKIWLDNMIVRDNEGGVETPSFYSVSYQQFAVYLFFLLLIFNLIYYTLVSFSFGEIFQIILKALLSSLVTFLLAVVYQVLLIRKSEN